jgi:hypothetical protein
MLSIGFVFGLNLINWIITQEGRWITFFSNMVVGFGWPVGKLCLGIYRQFEGRAISSSWPNPLPSSFFSSPILSSPWPNTFLAWLVWAQLTPANLQPKGPNTLTPFSFVQMVTEPIEESFRQFEGSKKSTESKPNRQQLILEIGFHLCARSLTPLPYKYDPVSFPCCSNPRAWSCRRCVEPSLPTLHRSVTHRRQWITIKDYHRDLKLKFMCFHCQHSPPPPWA